jgi:hypothetical protein
MFGMSGWLLWTQVRRLRLLVAALLLFTAALGVMGDATIQMPTVLGGGSAVFAWRLFVPLALAAVAASSFEVREHSIEWRSCRPVAAADATLFLLFLACSAALGITLTSDGTAAIALVRNIGILSGVAVAVTCWFGSGPGVTSATVLLLLTSSYFPGNRGAEYVRILQYEANPTWAAAMALLSITAATGSLLTPPAFGPRSLAKNHQ